MKTLWCKDLAEQDTVARVVGTTITDEEFFVKGVSENTSRQGEHYQLVHLLDRTGSTKAFYRGNMDLTSLVDKPVRINAMCQLSNGTVRLELLSAVEGEQTDALLFGIDTKTLSAECVVLRKFIDGLAAPYKDMVLSVFIKDIAKRVGGSPLTAMKGFSYNGGVLLHATQTLSMLEQHKSLSHVNMYAHVEPISYDVAMAAVVLRAIVECFLYTPQPGAAKTTETILTGDSQGLMLVMSALQASAIPRPEQDRIVHILKCMSDRRMAPATKECILVLGLSDLTYELDKFDRYLSDGYTYRDGHYLVSFQEGVEADE